MPTPSLARLRTLWRGTSRHDDPPTPPPYPGDSSERAFWPADVEIQATPPSPLGRSLLWLFSGMMVLGTVWSCIGTLDIVATAPGKIIPSQYTKVIQAPDQGIIQAIHINEGQDVDEGDVLIELDPTLNNADLARLQKEALSAGVDAARVRALLEGRLTLLAPPHTDPGIVTLHSTLLHTQLTEHQAHIQALTSQRQQHEAAIQSLHAQIAGGAATLKIQTHRAHSFQALYTQQFASQMDYLKEEEQRLVQEHALASLHAKLEQERAALRELNSRQTAILAEWTQTHQTELAAHELKIATLSEEIKKATERTSRQRLSAPVSGTVQQVAVHTVGGVVTPAQTLMMIVPHHDTIEIEASIANQDIGFVQEGAPVQVKFDAFPFTRYGTLPGRIVSISHDAAALPQGGGWAYPARIRLERDTIIVDGKTVRLGPGMTGTVEIHTGTRRVIEYVLSPLIQATHETARER